MLKEEDLNALLKKNLNRQGISRANLHHMSEKGSTNEDKEV